MAQTVQDWEHIIVGDACTDDTAEVVAEFADPRIRFVNRETNFGEQSGPNNDGFELATGSFIAYLNHDDLWFPDHLESLVGFLEETGADLVYSLPLEVDRNGLVYCGLTNAELRYDPSHFVVASLWLARRQLIEELGGWRSARDINALTPSQDLLTRAWQRGKDLRCSGHVTALFLAAGGRPNSYKLRDSSQHEALLSEMSDPRMRERLLTACARQGAMMLQELRTSGAGWLARLNSKIDRKIISMGQRPDAVRNWLTRRPKGWWVDHVHQFGGRPPLKRDR